MTAHCSSVVATGRSSSRRSTSLRAGRARPPAPCNRHVEAREDLDAHGVGLARRELRAAGERPGTGRTCWRCWRRRTRRSTACRGLARAKAAAALPGALARLAVGDAGRRRQTAAHVAAAEPSAALRGRDARHPVGLARADGGVREDRPGVDGHAGVGRSAAARAARRAAAASVLPLAAAAAAPAATAARARVAPVVATTPPHPCPSADATTSTTEHASQGRSIMRASRPASYAQDPQRAKSASPPSPPALARILAKMSSARLERLLASRGDGRGCRRAPASGAGGFGVGAAAPREARPRCPPPRRWRSSASRCSDASREARAARAPRRGHLAQRTQGDAELHLALRLREELHRPLRALARLGVLAARGTPYRARATPPRGPACRPSSSARSSACLSKPMAFTASPRRLCVSPMFVRMRAIRLRSPVSLATS